MTRVARRGGALHWVSAIAFLSAAFINANARPIEITSKQVSLSSFQPSRLIYGKLAWKGGISLASSKDGFGGFSGLALSNDGKRFISISDRGWWLRGQFNFNAAHNIVSVANTQLAKLKIARKSKQRSAHWLDSEALAPWGPKGIDGDLLVGFERRERLLRYRHAKNAFPAKPRRLKHPKGLSTGPFNAELEAVGRFYAGPRKNWLIAISEENLDKNGNIRGWTWPNQSKLKNKTKAFSLQRFEDYAITDLAVAPDGKSFYTLERSFNLPNLPGFALRKFNTNDLGKTKTLKGELLFAGRQPFFAIDNMEGLAVHKTKKAAIQLTIISDDNFNRSLQRTLIYRFEILPAKPPASQ